MLDCLIIGGGPAGLTAAIYLARFHLAVTVIDAGRSRAGMIPMTHNHAGFPKGITGRELLERMRAQAEQYGAQLLGARVERLARFADGFSASTTAGDFRAKTVLLATGVVNRRPTAIDDETHDLALSDGRLRYCPICDGYEVTDCRVAVIGTGERGYNEAIFLRGFTSDITLVAEDGHHLTTELRASLDAAGIGLEDACSRIKLRDGKIHLTTARGTLTFDSLYPALGSDIQSELAAQIQADCSEDGCLKVDAHQRTSVAGLFAAGDVVQGLDQISHAMGQGGVAATTIRNDLARANPIQRKNE